MKTFPIPELSESQRQLVETSYSFYWSSAKEVLEGKKQLEDALTSSKKYNSLLLIEILRNTFYFDNVALFGQCLYECISLTKKSLNLTSQAANEKINDALQEALSEAYTQCCYYGKPEYITEYFRVLNSGEILFARRLGQLFMIDDTETFDACYQILRHEAASTQFKFSTQGQATAFLSEIVRHARLLDFERLDRLFAEYRVSKKIFELAYQHLKDVAQSESSNIYCCGACLVANLASRYDVKRTIQLIDPAIQNNHSELVLALRALHPEEVEAHTLRSARSLIKSLFKDSPESSEINALRALDQTQKVFQDGTDLSQYLKKKMLGSKAFQNAETDEDAMNLVATLKSLFLRGLTLSEAEQEELKKDTHLAEVLDCIDRLSPLSRLQIPFEKHYKLEEETKRTLEDLAMSGILKTCQDYLDMSKSFENKTKPECLQNTHRL